MPRVKGSKHNVSFERNTPAFDLHDILTDLAKTEIILNLVDESVLQRKTLERIKKAMFALVLYNIIVSIGLYLYFINL